MGEAAVVRGFAAWSRAALLRGAHWAARRAGPARLAVCQALIVLLAAVWLSAGDLAGGVTGGILLLTALGVGALRRRCAAEGAFSALPAQPALLRTTAEFTAYAGVAAGGLAAGIATSWVWAVAALGVYGLRESVRAARWAAALPPPAGNAEPAPLSPVILADPSRGPEEPDIRLSAPRRVLRQHLVPSLGEGLGAGQSAPSPQTRRWSRFTQTGRFVVIAATAPIVDARVTFLVLVLGGVAALFVEAAGSSDPARGG